MTTPTSPTSLYQWTRWNLRNQRDVTIELRGPKGHGKSALALWVRKNVAPDVQGFNDLVYSHRDYIRRYKELRTLRKKGDRSIQFIWVDDATWIMNRRQALSKKNVAMVSLNRTMRSQVQAVQILNTQDDLLERPMMLDGPYALLVLDKPHKARYVRFKFDALNGYDHGRRTWGMTWPKPEKVYPNLWNAYKIQRETMTDRLNRELTGVIDKEPGSDGPPVTVDYDHYRDLFKQSIPIREISAIMRVTPQRVYKIRDDLGLRP